MARLILNNTGGGGSNGKSAYDIWLELGNEGTEQEFMDSLKGDKGDPGEKGETGANGTNGADGASITSVQFTQSEDGLITGGQATLSNGTTAPITIEGGA